MSTACIDSNFKLSSNFDNSILFVLVIRLGSLPISLGGTSKKFSKSQSFHQDQPYLLRLESDNYIYKFESNQKLHKNLTWDDLKEKKLTIKNKQKNCIEDENEKKEAERLYDSSCKKFFNIN